MSDCTSYVVRNKYCCLDNDRRYVYVFLSLGNGSYKNHIGEFSQYFFKDEFKDHIGRGQYY